MEIKETPSFIAFYNVEETELLLDETNHEKFPLKYFHVADNRFKFSPDASYYIFCYKGAGTLIFPGGPAQLLTEGMYASGHGKLTVNPWCSEFGAVVIEVYHARGEYRKTKFRAMNMVGGPIEKEGRLKYIDGCTDSLLIPPVKMGDPCFNHLHFPGRIKQTMHTHPSHRIGVVADGRGMCVTPFGNLPLVKGAIFVIKEGDGTITDGHPNGSHKFDTEDSHMDVIAFHPDSDFGATDIDHPMINRTIVDGVSASDLKEIQTQ